MIGINKVLAIGVLLLTGIWGLVSGSFIVSTVMFGAAATFSHIFVKR